MNCGVEFFAENSCELCETCAIKEQNEDMGLK